MHLNYIAKRNLITTHTADVRYDLEVSASQLVPGIAPVTEESQALDGTSETLGYRVDGVWSITTVPLGEDTDGEWDQVKEFLSSISFGETFVFDPYGTIAAPVNPKTAKLVRGSISTPQRVNPVSQTSNGTYQIGFQVRITE